MSILKAGGEKLLFPVIHCVSPKRHGVWHATLNTQVALDHGADGVFLIGHQMGWRDLVTVYEGVRAEFPEAFIGVNFLDLDEGDDDLIEALKMNPSALWTDACASEKLTEVVPPWIDIFSGVAFKYRNANAKDEEIIRECERTAQLAQVAVTSGDKTGQGPTVKKLQVVHRALGGRVPLAVASGASVENVGKMLPYVDIFKVASSLIEVDEARYGYEYLMGKKVRAFVNAIR